MHASGEKWRLMTATLQSLQQHSTISKIWKVKVKLRSESVVDEDFGFTM
jgi:hypothetical protein